MTVRGIDHDDIDLGLDQSQRPFDALGADAGGGGTTQSAQFVFVGKGVELGLVHVLDRDQADAAVAVVDHQQLLEPVAMQQPARLLGCGVRADGHQVVAGHQFIDFDRRIGGEADIAIGDHPDQPVGASFHHRETTDVMGLFQRHQLAEGLIRMHGQRVHHHPGLCIS